LTSAQPNRSVMLMKIIKDNMTRWRGWFCFESNEF
jgi:hypothetical protein